MNYSRDHSVDEGLAYTVTWNAAMLHTEVNNNTNTDKDTNNIIVGYSSFSSSNSFQKTRQIFQALTLRVLYRLKIKFFSAIFYSSLFFVCLVYLRNSSLFCNIFYVHFFVYS